MKIKGLIMEFETMCKSFGKTSDEILELCLLHKINIIDGITDDIKKRIQEAIHFENMCKKLGIDTKELRDDYSTIEELKKTTPGMVTCEVVRDATMVTEGHKLHMYKGRTIILPAGLYFRGCKDQYGRSQLKPCNIKFNKYFRRYAGEDLTNKKILIWRQGGIGDIMFSQPVVKYLKTKYPTCKIHYACAPRFKSIFESWPEGLIDKILPVPFSIQDMIGCHYHVCFEGGIERTLEARTVNAYDIFAKMAGLEIDQTDPQYYPELIPNQESIDKFKDIIPENSVVVQIRASSPIRMMKIDKWVPIINNINKLGYHVLFVDSPLKTALYDTIIKQYNLNEHMVHNLSKKSESLTDGIAIISLSKGVIGVDSSNIHLGTALSKPVFGIYAPFIGSVRMSYYKNADWYDVTKCECKHMPCFSHETGKFKCPYLLEKQPVICLASADDNEIFEKFSKLLSEFYA